MAGRVPHLKCDLLSVDRDSFALEVSADRGLSVSGVSRGELVDKSGLTDSNVAKKDDLCEELLLVRFNH